MMSLILLSLLTVQAQSPAPGVVAPGAAAPGAGAPVEKLPVEKEMDVVDFQNVKNVLKKDGLSQEVKKKKAEVRKIQQFRVVEDKGRFAWPSEEEFWPIAGQWWLVKNVTTLKWDFDRPEYGLEGTMIQLLKETGFLQKKFRILAIESNQVPHLGLPWSKDEYCLLFSVPFARTLDLSKLEIALLLLEDILRIEEGWLQDFARPAKLKALAGTNFQGSAPDMTPIHDVAKAYTQFTQEKGFTFQQQFKITKRMDAILRPRPELWNTYVRMLNKIDGLIKVNQQFKDYTKLYPSPEMQIKWLAPEDKIL